MTALLFDTAHEVFPALTFKAANTNADAWSWRRVKKKTDMTDAERLLRMYRLDDFPEVYMPDTRVRALRRLTMYRSSLVSKRTACYNAIRICCKQHGIALPTGEKAWTAEALDHLRTQHATAPSSAVWSENTLWCLELAQLLAQLDLLSTHIAELEIYLQREIKTNTQVQHLTSAPGVGQCLAVALFAFIGDAQHFPNRRAMAAYFGLVPRLYQSGKTMCMGRITKAGNRQVRCMLINAAWIAIRHSAWAQQLFERLVGSTTNKRRRKVAIIGVARQLLIRLWRMMRDGQTWKEAPTGVEVVTAA